MRPRAASIAIAIALLGAQSALAAPAVEAGKVTAEGGGAKAVLEYTKLAPAGGSAPAGTRAELLTITRAGATTYTSPVSSPNCSPCGLEEFVGSPPALSIADLESPGEPDVILHLYTGGAHCCSIIQIFSYDAATSSYHSLERDFGDPGARVEDIAGSGHLELRSADDRFAYEFKPYAYSGLPLQIWSLRGGRLVDVTRSFPAALAADAARWLKIFRGARHNGTGTGVIAAWAADEELLGHGALVKRTLAREAARGNLRSREHLGPSGRAFVTELLRFLRHLGYR